MSDFRSHWRERAYWSHLHRKYADVLRNAALLAVVLLVGAVGFIVAQSLSEPETFTVERLVTVTTLVDGELVTHVERQVVTMSEPNETQTNLVTVVRDGETITIPAKTVLRTDTVKVKVTGPTITDIQTEVSTRTRTQTERETTTNTETQTQTDTQTHTTDRTTTVTEERNVPGPTTTVTTTVTETGPTTTVTDTETQTETDTVTVTETVTEPPGPNP